MSNTGIVFTIVAKNYLSLAFTLADSIEQTDAGQQCIIYLLDDKEGVEKSYFEKYNIQVVSDLAIPDFEQMAFKYAITEFCTAVKPFIMDHLLSDGGFDQVIYFDPDIYVYASLSNIFNLLTANDIVITPHIVSMLTQQQGNAPDTELLFAGIYNLGFIAVKKSTNVDKFLDWWKNRLAILCYADRMESLHVDQKWIDFLPAFFDRGLHISRYLGFNIAYWNIHERSLFFSGNTLMVSSPFEKDKTDAVVFLHYSGVKPDNIYTNRQCAGLDIQKYPVWEQLTAAYAAKVLANGFHTLIKLQYKYATFSNGQSIIPLHRRQYRKIIELQVFKFLKEPFNSENAFYKALDQNKLLVGTANTNVELTASNKGSFEKRLTLIDSFLIRIKQFLGISKYLLLIRFLQKYFKLENQIFLISELRKEAEKNYLK